MGEQSPPPRLVDALAVAARVVSRSVQEVLEREEGVSLDQWRALRSLSRDEGRTMGELAERLQIPAASLTRLVDGLVDNALVYRYAPTTDRRRVEVLLSDAGAAALSRLEDLVRIHEDHYRRLATVSVDGLIAALDSTTKTEFTPTELVPRAAPLGG